MEKIVPLEKTMPCEVCGNDVAVDRPRKAYLCKLHRGIVNQELVTSFVPESRTSKVIVYYANSTKGRSLVW